MSSQVVRILFLADTHLGFDLPFRPRVQRRRRGHDFFANFERALRPAMQGQVDLVIHGGDLFYRSRVPAALVDMALAPLAQVAEHGVPVYIVPGNHERSRIPSHLWTAHPGIHIFHESQTFLWQRRGVRLALAGFPFHRRVRDDFNNLVDKTGYREVPADIRLLCLHQAIEGAQVGPSDYTFRRGQDVIRGRDLSRDFDAVLSGHIHRSQMLTHDLTGRPLPSSVVYPGSIERTSFAERDEGKHYVKLSIHLPEDGGCAQPQVEFVPLPARPMIDLEIKVQGLGIGELSHKLRSRLGQLDPESIVRIKVEGPLPVEAESWLSAAFVRSLAPASMNVSLSYPAGPS